MMLPSEESRVKKLTEKESRTGVIEWNDDFPENVNRKLYSALKDSVSSISIVEKDVRNSLLLHSADGRADHSLFLLLEEYAGEWAYAAPRLDAIAALGPVMKNLHKTFDGTHYSANGITSRYRFAAPEFFQYVNDLFLANRIDWEFIDGRLIPRGNQELHASVVIPTLELLSGDAELSSVETAYNKALAELGKGETQTSISAAGVALQGMLESVGASGNTIGKLASDAIRSGLLAGADDKLTRAIQLCLDWASAERSTNGLTHKTAQPARDDAWLMIHITGALILRLSKSTPRAI